MTPNRKVNVMARPKKKKPEEVRTERIIFNVTPATLKKIDELADKLKMPRSQFMNSLVEVALDENELMIKLVAATVLPAKELIASLKSDGKKRVSKRSLVT